MPASGGFTRRLCGGGFECAGGAQALQRRVNLLLMVWTNQAYRPTKDLDMLSFGESKPDILQRSIVEICHAEIESDGLDFDADSIEISEIREGHKYQGH